mmetsp:Transcript_13445/g.58804  ORF Transcript_13445/g.58804 Transcript_13445/m.58804 type:complete len:220 (-) Transcript_13445:71-730(-)
MRRPREGGGRGGGRGGGKGRRGDRGGHVRVRPTHSSLHRRRPRRRAPKRGHRRRRGLGRRRRRRDRFLQIRRRERRGEGRGDDARGLPRAPRARVREARRRALPSGSILEPRGDARGVIRQGGFRRRRAPPRLRRELRRQPGLREASFAKGLGSRERVRGGGFRVQLEDRRRRRGGGGGVSQAMRHRGRARDRVDDAREFAGAQRVTTIRQRFDFFFCV